MLRLCKLKKILKKYIVKWTNHVRVFGRIYFFGNSTKGSRDFFFIVFLEEDFFGAFPAVFLVFRVFRDVFRGVFRAVFLVF